MCRLVSYRHVIANAPAGTFVSPPLGWFFSCLLYLILVCVCVVWWRCFESTDCRERIFIYCIHKHRFLCLFSPIVPQEKSNETKQASACFVREKKKTNKKTRWWNEKGQLHPCLLFFCPFPRLFFIIICIWFVETALIALDMIRDKTVRSPKPDFLFGYFYFYFYLFIFFFFFWGGGSFFLQDV